jgi:hypothetical protein
MVVVASGVSIVLALPIVLSPFWISFTPQATSGAPQRLSLRENLRRRPWLGLLVGGINFATGIIKKS